MLVEVCANSVQSAMNAERAGADQIEICSELSIGGVTPSIGLLKEVKKHVSIPVHVLIRPRSGDFSYSDAEFKVMQRDVSQCVAMGFDGIVSGILHNDFTLDLPRTRKLISLSKGLKFTFHRAFDWVKDPIESFKKIEGVGADYVLTSGQRSTALQGLSLLTELQKLETKCMVMPGGGINENNAAKFKAARFKAIHLSASRIYKTLNVPPLVSMSASKLLGDDEISVSDEEEIRAVVKKVKTVTLLEPRTKTKDNK